MSMALAPMPLKTVRGGSGFEGATPQGPNAYVPKDPSRT
jgi:hypothetical protein